MTPFHFNPTAYGPAVAASTGFTDVFELFFDQQLGGIDAGFLSNGSGGSGV